MELEARALSPDQRVAIESLLGRRIGEEETVSVFSEPPAPEWLQRSWESAELLGVDRLTRDEIEAEIDAARRERTSAR